MKPSTATSSPLRRLDPAQVREFFDGHRTVRQYQTDGAGGPLPLPPADLEAMLHAAQRAPTDATSQLYSIVQVTEPARRGRLAELTQNAHIATAGAAFVVCLDVWRIRKLLEVAGSEAGEWPHMAVHFGIGDAALAGANLLTAAEMLGYQGCWIGGVMHDLRGVIALLELPRGVLPYAALTVGLSAETPPLRPRLPRELVVHTERYVQPSAEELRAGTEQMNPIAARGDEAGDWARLLRAYWGEGRAMQQRDAELAVVLAEQGLAEQR